MWVDFFIQVAFLFAIMYLPSTYLLRALDVDETSSLSFAPAVSVGLYYALSYVYRLVGFSTRWFHVVLPVAAILLFAGLYLRRSKAGGLFLKGGGYRLPFVYAAISILICGFWYVLPLNGADSVVQLYDNAHHLDQVRAFLDSGYYAPGSIVSYPSLSYSLAAICADFSARNPALSINALNFVLMVFVLPFALLGFLRTVWPERRSVQLCGAVVPLVFIGYPWSLQTFGPLYPLMFANAFIPIASAAFLRMLRAFSDHGRLCLNVVLFLLSAFVLGCSHPSAVFTAVLLLAPYYVVWAFKRGDKKGCLFGVSFSALALLSVCLFWIGCYRHPSFSGVVNFGWYAWDTFSGALANLVGFDFSGFGVTQTCCFVFLIVGSGFIAAKSKNERWMIVSVLLAALQYLTSVSIDGEMRRLFIGFWYNDSYRLAANFVIAAMPIISFGIGVAAETLSGFFKVARRTSIEADCSKLRERVPVLIQLVIMFVFFICSTACVSPADDGGSYSPYGLVASRLSWLNQLGVNASPLDERERSFLREVKDTVGDEVVINYPYDGSVFGAPDVGINLAFPTFSLPGKLDPSVSELICSGASQVATDDAVLSAFKESGVRYLLLLDCGRMNNDEGASYSGDGFYYVNYIPEDWHGFERLTCSTQGYTAVLQEEDMCLLELSI